MTQPVYTEAGRSSRRWQFNLAMNWIAALWNGNNVRPTIVDQAGEGRLPMPDIGIPTRQRRWIAIFALIALGVLIGASGISASTEINRATSSDAFCMSCHTM